MNNSLNTEDVIKSDQPVKKESESANPLKNEKDNIEQLSEISKNTRSTFFAIILTCVYSYLAISTTNDAALLSNSGATPLPIIQTNVPIVWFYYFAPVILAVLFVYFHLDLERFWRCIIRLPLFHPDGRGLDEYVYPWLISTTFIRGGIHKLGGNRLLARLEFMLSVFLGWCLIPLVLLFYWARYLVAHDWRGTLLHAGLILFTTGFAFRFYYLAKNAVLAIANNATPNTAPFPSEMAMQFKRWQIRNAFISLLLLGAALSYLSLSAIYGSPADNCRMIATESNCKFFIFGTELLTWTGACPFADVTEKKFVAKPENWQDLLDNPDGLRRYLETQSRLTLSNRNFRHLKGQRAFLPASRIVDTSFDYADLEHAVLIQSELMDVTFCGTNLSHIDLQHARLIGAQFENVVADAARFNHADLKAGKTGKKTSFINGEYPRASFQHCTGQELMFFHPVMRETHFLKAKIGWSTFQNVDLTGAIFEKTELTNNKFYETDFSEAKIIGDDQTNDFPNFSYSEFYNCTFRSTTIKNAVFEGVTIKDTTFDHAESITNAARNVIDGAEIENTTSDHAESITNAARNVIDGLYGFSAKIIRGKINNTHFKNANLHLATFEDVTFSNTLFSDTDLSDATFIRADFSGVTFEKVDFSGADLEQVTGLSDRHLRNICGNKETKLPPELTIDSCIKQ